MRERTWDAVHRIGIDFTVPYGILLPALKELNFIAFTTVSSLLHCHSLFLKLNSPNFMQSG